MSNNDDKKKSPAQPTPAKPSDPKASLPIDKNKPTFEVANIDKQDIDNLNLADGWIIAGSDGCTTK